MRVLVPALLSFALFAGCLAAAPSNDPATPSASGAFIDPIVDDHDHASFEDHAKWTPSMSLVGHTTMNAEGQPFSYIGEMDTYENLTVVQVLGRGSMPGFVVIDTSDKANPTPIGRAEMPYSYVVDVKFSPDGKRVFAASQAGTRPQQSNRTIQQDPVTAALQGNGFTEWDVTDPTKPKAVAGGLAPPFGCHMLSVQDIGGKRYVFCIASGAVHIFHYTAAGAWVQASALTAGTTAQGASQVAGEVIAAGPNAPFALMLSAGPHDVTVQPDPKEPGRLVASVSYWDFGVRFYDVTNPLQPRLLGAWAGQGAQRYEGNSHGAALFLHEGKRMALIGPELLGKTHPAMHFLDLDDFASPKLVGEWAPPGEHVSNGLLLTTHQFQIVDGRIYLAYNHAGVWVLDIATILEGAYQDDPARPEVLGYYLPHQKVTLFDPKVAAVPNTWDVNVKDGYIFASDRYTGFYVLHYEGDVEGDATHTSRT